MQTMTTYSIQIKNLLEYKQIKENENFSKKVLTNFIIYDIISQKLGKVEYNMKVLNNMYKFTDTNADISDSLVYKTLEVAENGNYKEFKKLYKELSKQQFGATYLKVGKYRLMGYEFDFKPFLKRFLIKDKYNNDYTVLYALNKTNIFDNFYISKSSVIDILEDTRHKVLV